MLMFNDAHPELKAALELKTALEPKAALELVTPCPLFRACIILLKLLLRLYHVTIASVPLLDCH